MQAGRRPWIGSMAIPRGEVPSILKENKYKYQRQAANYNAKSQEKKLVA